VNTRLATAPVRHDHPPRPLDHPDPRPVRRVALLDRIALHLGVALIRWGRRPLAPSRAAFDSAGYEQRRQLERDRFYGLNLVRSR
jgi:hypothetical protein